MNQCHLVIHAWSLALKDRGPARLSVMASEAGAFYATGLFAA
jgi:hypothetical protein